MGSLNIFSAGAVNTITLALLITGLAVVGSRKIDRAIRVVAAQSLLIAILVAIVGYTSHNWHLYLVALLVFVVKGLTVPVILLNVLNGVCVKAEEEMFVGRTVSLVIASGLALLAYWVTGPFIDLGAPRNQLSISLALVLVGLFIMVSRKTALMQVMGLLLMENGLFLTAISTTLGMPLVVEMGIFLDVLVSVGIMAILSRRINGEFAGIETTKLNTLKG